MDKRVSWIDVAKGVAILLVCAGHTKLAQMGILNSWINSFHMAFFFFIAGYCFKPERYKTYGDYALRKIKALGYPYVMLCLVVAALGFLLMPGRSLSQAATSAFLPYAGCHVIGFWFVRVLFLVELAYAIRKSFAFQNILAVVSLAAIVLASFGFRFVEPECIRPTTVLSALFFYHCGALLGRHGQRFVMLRTGWCAPVAVVFVVLQVGVLWIAGWPQFSFGVSLMQGRPLVFVAAAISGTLSLLSLSKCLDAIPVVRTAFAYLGRNSLCLLAVHPICGQARASWVATCPQMGTVLSYVLEVVAISFCLWLLSGPLKIMAKWPKRGGVRC